MRAATSSQLDRVFSALSDPTRRALLRQLARGERSISELAEPFQMSLPAVSKHIRVLEHAGLLSRRIEGRVHWCRLAAEPMKEAVQWLERYRAFWGEGLDTLAKYLEE